MRFKLNMEGFVEMQCLQAVYWKFWQKYVVFWKGTAGFAPLLFNTSKTRGLGWRMASAASWHLSGSNIFLKISVLEGGSGWGAGEEPKSLLVLISLGTCSTDVMDFHPNNQTLEKKFIRVYRVSFGVKRWPRMNFFRLRYHGNATLHTIWCKLLKSKEILSSTPLAMRASFDLRPRYPRTPSLMGPANNCFVTRAG